MCFGVCLHDCHLQTSLFAVLCNSNCPATKGRRAAWSLPGGCRSLWRWFRLKAVLMFVLFCFGFFVFFLCVCVSFGQSVVAVVCRFTLLSSVSPTSSHWHCCCYKSAWSNLGNYPVSDLSHHTPGCCLEHANLFLTPSPCSCKQSMDSGGHKIQFCTQQKLDRCVLYTELTCSWCSHHGKKNNVQSSTFCCVFNTLIKLEIDN